jgi:hypothetical protein
MLLLALTTFAISISTQFEAGSASPVERVSETHFRVGVAGEADQDKRNRQASWYYFRIDGAKGRTVTIELTNLLGEYNYQSGVHAVTRNTRPVWSEDNRSWEHLEKVEWDDTKKELRFQVTPRTDRLWVAHVPPYTTEHLKTLLADLRRETSVRVESVGKTVQGREIPLVTLNDRAGGRPVIWIMARQHAWETGTSHMMDAALRWLVSSDPEARHFRTAATWKIFPMADPDGCARGGVRYNANGYDLNRNWDNVDPKLMPEIAAQRAALLRWIDGGRKIDFFLTLHNQENTDHVEGLLTLGGFEALGRAFYNNLKENTSFSSRLSGPRDSPATTTPGKKGRMNVIQGLFHERQVPAFLLETSVEPVTSLGRPRTVEDWQAFGPGLVRAVFASTVPSTVK